MLFSLKDKVAIVTGSSKGIGRASAEEMAKLGAKVVVSSRKLPLCEEVVAGIKANGGEATAMACHVGYKEQLQALVDNTIAKYGKLDILVINAASNTYFGPMGGASDSDFDKIISTNIKSSWWLTNIAVPKMQNGGSIIVVGSVGGLVGNGALGIYGMTKAADGAFIRNLSVELGPRNIRANLLAPGLVKTDFAKALWDNPDILKATMKACPLGRIAEPIEMAGIVCFLASDAASYVNGHTLVADGGAITSDPFHQGG